MNNEKAFVPCRIVEPFLFDDEDEENPPVPLDLPMGCIGIMFVFDHKEHAEAFCETTDIDIIEINLPPMENEDDPMHEM